MTACSELVQAGLLETKQIKVPTRSSFKYVLQVDVHKITEAGINLLSDNAQ